MSHKNTIFYRGKTAVTVNFSALDITSDGAFILLEKLEREHKVLDYFSKIIPEWRNPLFVTHDIKKLLTQRVFMMMQGYEDTNDVHHLKNDAVLQDVLRGTVASQSSLSRFENSLNKHSIFSLLHAWVDRYVSSLKGRTEITIDIDGTDDPTYGHQQLSMYNAYYGQFMYNELFFHDGDTGQIIAPVLRPGNSHSNKWYVAILKRIIKKIRAVYPDMKIIIRGDSGFSCAPFYQLVADYNLKFVLGLASNEVLKRKVAKASKAVELHYLRVKKKHQHFFGYRYQAGSWPHEHQCYAKVESTGKGMNVRHIVSNLPEATAREIYFGVYVKRGEASENRIKEVKNMCFSDRLSNHGYWANFFRLFLSSLTYELFLLLKTKIKKTTFAKAKTWQIDTIRTYLLKIGARIKKTKRRIYYELSNSFVYQKLFQELIA